MKIDRHGQAAILTQAEIAQLFNEGLPSPRDRALFGICLYVGCRIREACTLNVKDVYDRHWRVRPELLIRKGNTKGKLASRSIPVIDELQTLLNTYSPPKQGYLFPGRHGRGHIHPDSAGAILREACEKIGLEGVSTHSFRRTALTQLSNAGIPLRVIQEISGHRTLDELYKYLEVKPEQVRGAAAALSMLSYTSDNYIGKPLYNDVESESEPVTVSEFIDF